MKCVIRYKKIIWNTPPEDSEALRTAFLSGDGLCPSCKRDGLDVQIEERYGETP